MGGEGNLKNVLYRRAHKERPQPAARRQRLGYLEKHKDYVRRAKDYHRKQDTVKKLHRKAYFKNEDEFTFAMLSHRQQDGRLRKKGTHLSEPELKLLDSQDARYVGVREQMDKKAAEKAAKNLHFLDAERPNRHVLFVDEDDVASGGGNIVVSSSSSSLPGASGGGLKDYNVAAHFDTHPALLPHKANRLHIRQLETGVFADRAALQSEGRHQYKQLLHRQERGKKLRRVREELELRNNLRTKGKRKKVADAENGRSAIYKWFPERKR